MNADFQVDFASDTQSLAYEWLTNLQLPWILTSLFFLALALYDSVLEELIPQFDSVTFTHTPRVSNHFVDALVTLASMIKIPLGFKMRPLI